MFRCTTPAELFELFKRHRFGQVPYLRIPGNKVPQFLAVKILRRELADHPIVRQRFEREVRAAARIEHPNVAQIFRFGRLADGTPFYVLPYVAATLIVLFTPIFFLLGVIIYKLVRPAERIGEVSERQLAEEALLAEVESIRSCPTCHRRVHEEWIICPICRTRLNRVCPNCGKLVGLDWSLCAWCGKDFERREAAAVGALPPAPEPATIAPRASARSSGSPAPDADRQAKPRPASPRSRGTVGSPDALPER